MIQCLSLLISHLFKATGNRIQIELAAIDFVQLQSELIKLLLEVEGAVLQWPIAGDANETIHATGHGGVSSSVQLLLDNI